jgi:hypothetical protein
MVYSRNFQKHFALFCIKSKETKGNIRKRTRKERGLSIYVLKTFVLFEISLFPLGW